MKTMEKTKACHCECHMSSGHSFGQKRLIPLGVSKSVVIASDRTGLSICRARIERSNLLRLCTRLPDSNDPFLGSGGNELKSFQICLVGARQSRRCSSFRSNTT